MIIADILPTGTFLAVSPFITAGVLGSLFAFTVVYARRAQMAALTSQVGVEGEEKPAGTLRDPPLDPLASAAASDPDRPPRPSRRERHGRRSAAGTPRQRRSPHHQPARGPQRHQRRRELGHVGLHGRARRRRLVLGGRHHRQRRQGLQRRHGPQGVQQRRRRRHHGRVRRLRRPHPAGLPQADHRRRQRLGPGRRTRDHVVVRSGRRGRPRHLRHPRGQAGSHRGGGRPPPAPQAPARWRSRWSWP